MSSIFLSAGHSPSDPGACDNNGNCEWEIADKWVHQIHYDLLPYISSEIVPTGTLKEKVNYINNRSPKLAIEVHFNSNVKAKGSETLYFPGSKNGKMLAEMIQSQFTFHNVFQPNRGTLEGWYQQDKSKGVLYFLRKTNCTSVIIEPQFISNFADIEKNMLNGCDAIAKGILQYWETIYGDICDTRVL